MTDLGLTRSHSVVFPTWHHPSPALGPSFVRSFSTRSSFVVRSTKGKLRDMQRLGIGYRTAQKGATDESKGKYR